MEDRWWTITVSKASVDIRYMATLPVPGFDVMRLGCWMGENPIESSVISERTHLHTHTPICTGNGTKKIGRRDGIRPEPEPD